MDWTKDRTKKKLPQSAASKKINWTGQNEMRDFLSRVTAGAKGRIFNFVHSEKLRTQKKVLSDTAKVRTRIAKMTS